MNYSGVVDKPGSDVEVGSVGNVAGVEEGTPGLSHLGAVLLVEGSCVGQEGCRDQHISHQPDTNSQYFYVLIRTYRHVLKTYIQIHKQKI